ncbi:MAG: glucose-6-phosphate isomerase [Anaerocolumna sp.]|jgi:glucose-6-phosphate isomerase|nr:glucose-6-phosphate isomerase [Anaerocolumna sp.]
MDNYIPVNPFTIGFDLKTGISQEAQSTKRPLSKMSGMYNDTDAFQEILEKEDPVVYEFYELKIPNTDKDLLFGTSITYPGKVGKEYYMTKGHFHEVLDTAEVYYTLSGEGYMLMETPEGEWTAEPLSAGKAVYVPPRWAHRSINTGNIPLITFFTFRGDAGHDYGTIEQKGYRRLIVEGKDGKPEIIENPKWKQ